ncbi:MAG: Ldh family oxidoreductase [Rhodospirillales bacterium]
MAKRSLEEIDALAVAVLRASRTSADNAESVARALVKADRDGLPSHGAARLPAFSAQAIAGKVDGFAEPKLTVTGDATLRVDAASGFAFPAIDLGLNRAQEIAGRTGVVAVAVGHSHNAGVMGHHTERMAEHGLAALAFTNSFGAISPWGGHRPLFGTNPIAFSCPRKDAPPLVVDVSLSKVARGKVKLAADRGEPIPEGWCLDADGKPTTDAKAGFTGSFLPMGDARGAALVLMVELLCSAMTGSNFAFEASSLYDADGPPPHVGQLFVVFKPESLGGETFADRAEELMAAIVEQPGTRLPGSRRLDNRAKAEKDGVEIPDDLLAALDKIVAAG